MSSSAFQHYGRTILLSKISSKSNIYSHVMFNIDSCCSVLFIGLKMALFNRIGNMLKQTVSRHTNLELCATRTSLYQAIRSMSSSKLFVGGKRILFPVVCSCYVLFPSFCCSIMAPTIPCRSLIWHWWNLSARGILPTWSSDWRYFIYVLTSDKIRFCSLLQLRGSWSL